MRTIKFRDILTTADAPLSVRRHRHGTMDVHTHTFHELVFIRRGSGLHCMNDARAPFQAGDIFLIPQNRPHGYIVEEKDGVELDNIMFPDHLLSLAGEDLSRLTNWQILFLLQPSLSSELRVGAGMLHLDAQGVSELLPLLEKAEKLSSHTARPGNRTELLGLFLQILSLIVRNGRIGEQDGLGGYVSRISLILAEFNRSPERNWTLRSMADYLHMSPANFRLQFRKLTGIPPGRYLLEQRLRKAASLLSGTAKSIGETASESGFRDSNYFARQFRARYGISPQRYRKNLRKKPDHA